ncbi:hypothetical protein LguiA_003245 [Lonicera macranthoides]
MIRLRSMSIGAESMLKSLNEYWCRVNVFWDLVLSISWFLTCENRGSDNNEDTRTTALKIKRMKYIKSSETTIQKNIKRVLLERKMEQFENESEKVISSEFSERSNSSNHATNPCKGLETFEKFHIMVNGLCVDSKLHENMRKKYYELCCCKDAILHDGLLPSLSIKLVAGVISEP